MKFTLKVCVAAFVLIAGVTFAAGQSPASVPQKSLFAGTWEGRINDLPGIELEIQQVDRKLGGTVTFFFQERRDTSGPWHVAGKSTLPLLVPHIDGKTLTFEVEHHRCHGCSELGPNAKFRMVLAAANEARLWNLSEETDSSQGLQLIRGNKSAGSKTQAMQRGISVDLPVTYNATSIPSADRKDSLIVSIAGDGSLYFGLDPVNRAELADKMRKRLAKQTSKSVYIKADTRTAYADVVNVLLAVRAVGAPAPIFLTAQKDSSDLAMIVPPKGLAVRTSPSSPDSPVVRLLNLGPQAPVLTVNGHSESLTALQRTLDHDFQSQRTKELQLIADGSLPFGDVVLIIDVCRSAGAEVVMVTPAL